MTDPTAASPLSSSRSAWACRMLDTSVIGVAVFLFLCVALQTLPPHYSFVRQAISDLAVGPYGWIMAVAFLIGGVAVTVFVVGAFIATAPRERPTVGLVLLAVWGLASLAIAFFPTDIVDAGGYPGTAAAFARSTTRHGVAHLSIAAVAFPSMVLGLVASSLSLMRNPALRGIRIPTLVLSAVAVCGLFLIDPIGTNGPFGLVERGTSLAGYVWVIIVARALRGL